MVPRRRGPRAPHPRLHPLERGGHGRQGQQARRRHRRPPLHLRLLGRALRRRLQPLLPRQGRRPRRRPRLLPGPRRARHLRPGLPRGPPHRGAARPLPPGDRRQRPVVVPAPAAHARLLGVPDGVDGPRPALLDLPGPLQPVPPQPPDRRHRGVAGVVLHRRRRERRARDARLDLAGRPRGPRQPHLGRQLQPAAPRRPGARQRQDHPGARGRLPRRRAGTSSRSSGAASGTSCCARRRRRAAQPDEQDRRRRVPALRHRVRRLHPRALLRPRPAAAQAGRAPVRRRAPQPAPRRPRLPEALRRLQGRHRAGGRAHRDPRQDDQGLDARRRRRGPQRHPPDQEDDQRPAAARCASGCTSRTRSPRRRWPTTRSRRTSSSAEDSEIRQYMLDRRQALDGSLPRRVVRTKRPLALPADGGLRRGARRLGQAGGVDHHRLHPAAAQPVPRPEVRPARRADHPRRGPHLRHGLAVQGVRHLRVAGPAVRARRPRPAAVLHGEQGAARSSRRASPRPARWPASSPPARATPPAACRWCRSSPSIRCSASSGWATSSGRPPTPGPAASCSAPPPGARRCSARASSTRTATASCWRRCPVAEAYDPAFAYEMATIVRHGLRRMSARRTRTSSTT